MEKEGRERERERMRARLDRLISIFIWNANEIEFIVVPGCCCCAILKAYFDSPICSPTTAYLPPMA